MRSAAVTETMLRTLVESYVVSAENGQEKFGDAVYRSCMAWFAIGAIAHRKYPCQVTELVKALRLQTDQSMDGIEETILASIFEEEVDADG